VKKSISKGGGRAQDSADPKKEGFRGEISWNCSFPITGVGGIRERGVGRSDPLYDKPQKQVRRDTSLVQTIP